MNNLHSGRRLRPGRRLRLFILGQAALIAAAHLFGGCMTGDMSDGTSDTTKVDPFPRPMGEAFIPLVQDPLNQDGPSLYSHFDYVEFDTAGGLVMRQDLSLDVVPMANDAYGYAFENPRQGMLLGLKTGGGNLDSAGIYIVGRFQDAVLSYFPAPVMWLPQFPKPGVKWSLEPGREMELVRSDTVFYTKVLFTTGDEGIKAPIEYGFQRQPSTLFRETYGDTLTYYHFRRGVGCLGFERSVRGKLIASGAIRSFRGEYRRP
jgi:hypothetical protein